MINWKCWESQRRMETQCRDKPQEEPLPPQGWRDKAKGGIGRAQDRGGAIGRRWKWRKRSPSGLIAQSNLLPVHVFCALDLSGTCRRGSLRNVIFRRMDGAQTGQ